MVKATLDTVSSSLVLSDLLPNHSSFLRIFSGFEYEPGPDGQITWFVNETASWRILASAIGPNEETQIGQRLISEEPMVCQCPFALLSAFLVLTNLYPHRPSRSIWRFRRLSKNQIGSLSSSPVSFALSKLSCLNRICW